MQTRSRSTRTIAAGAAATLAAVTALVVAASPADAAVAPTVTVKMSDSAITFSGGGSSTAHGATHLRPGRYKFHVVSKGGAHALQLVRFRNGYTPEQAQSDFNGAFSGDVAAVQRIDNGVVFLGGASANDKRAGDMAVTLSKGPLMALDQNGQAAAFLTVSGARRAGTVAHHGTYTAFTYGWGTTRHLPASGMVRFANQADQPHFLVLQRVKDGTTNKQVRKFINGGMRGNPSWALKANADSGVVSAGKSQLFSYDLPAGKYLIACFWPDYFSGMPHFAMGMWKLVRLS
jgi:hypothetical protein